MLQKTIFTLSFLVFLLLSFQIQAQDYGDIDKIIGTTWETDYGEITFEEGEGSLGRTAEGFFMKDGVKQGHVKVDGQPMFEGMTSEDLVGSGALGDIYLGYVYFLFNADYTSFEANIQSMEDGEHTIKFNGTKK